jgi:hypothetical protein
VTTVLVLVILGLIWGFVLIPPYLQNRRESRPSDSIASFRQQLSVLERTTPGSGSGNLSRLDVGRYDIPRYDPRSNVSQLAARPRPGQGPSRRPSAAAMRRAEVRRRRRDVFVTLLGAVGVSFLLAVVLGGSVWMLHVVIDVAFLAYVAMLVSIQQQSAEREMKVRHLPPTAPHRPRQQAPQLAMRRYGS